MIVRDLPSQFGEKTCNLVGTGKWKGPDNEQGSDLVYTATAKAPDICQSGPYSGFELAGHSKPYSLYWILGDPDSGTGVWLKHEKE
jgi:hypothetical protein